MGEGGRRDDLLWDQPFPPPLWLPCLLWNYGQYYVLNPTLGFCTKEEQKYDHTLVINICNIPITSPPDWTEIRAHNWK